VAVRGEREARGRRDEPGEVNAWRGPRGESQRRSLATSDDMCGVGLDRSKGSLRL
jgi:hypothetical protein